MSQCSDKKHKSKFKLCLEFPKISENQYMKLNNVIPSKNVKFFQTFISHTYRTTEPVEGAAISLCRVRSSFTFLYLTKSKRHYYVS